MKIGFALYEIFMKKWVDLRVNKTNKDHVKKKVGPTVNGCKRALMENVYLEHLINYS